VPVSSCEDVVVARLRAGDDSAFNELVTRYQPQLIRLAGLFVANLAVAEEVAQETWVALLVGIDRFEQRSSLRTWLFQICVNRARTTGLREHRTLVSDRVESLLDEVQSGSSSAWPADLDDSELIAAARTAIKGLPSAQRRVVTMRDLNGLTSAQVCQALGLSETNQRVLLHRGRTQVRRAINAGAA